MFVLLMLPLLAESDIPVLQDVGNGSMLVIDETVQVLSPVRRVPVVGPPLGAAFELGRDSMEWSSQVTGEIVRPVGRFVGDRLRDVWRLPGRLW